MTQREIPPLPRDSWLLHHIVTTLKQGGSITIVTSGRNAQTNLGKTIFNLWVAQNLNPDLDIRKQAFYDAEGFNNAYYDSETYGKGTVLMKEEAQDFHKRRHMKSENVEGSIMIQEGRSNQRVAIMSLPNFQSLDKEIKEVIDIWCHVHRPGRVMVHGKYIPDYKDKIFFPQKEILEFPNLDWHPDYEELERMKQEHFEERNSDDDEEEEKVDVDKLKTQARDNEIRYRYADEDITQKELAEEYGVTRQRIGQIINEGKENDKEMTLRY